jgi:EmrB/QacA subfamily drug resistance transporter
MDRPSTTAARWTLAGVCATTFMLLLDVTIVNVALPSLGRDLDGDLTDLQWIVDAYAIVLAALTLSAGAAADRFGRRRIFLAGLTIFTAASLACGLAGSTIALELARAVQGVGGAAMFATSLALIGQEYDGPGRAHAFAAWGASAGAGVASGPLAGGILTDLLDWRWIFFVNVPIGVVTLALMWSRLRANTGLVPRRLDVPGASLFSGALSLLAYGLLRGNGDGWGSRHIVVALLAAAVLLVAFLVVERRSTDPMIDLALFRAPALVGATLALLCLAAGMFANIFFLSLYLQDVLGYSALGAGLRLLFLSSLVFAVPLLARPLVSRVGPRLPMALGLLAASAGLVALTVADDRPSWGRLVPGLVLAGLGIGLANPVVASVPIAVVEGRRAGMASGLSNTVRMTGLALGIATLGAVFQARISHALGSHDGLAPAVAARGVHAVPATSALAPQVASAFGSGLDLVLVIGAVLTLLGAIAGAALVRMPARPTATTSTHLPEGEADVEPVVAG